MSLPVHLHPYGLPIDINARSIDKDSNLTAVQKAERAIEICLPITDPEVAPYARRWVAAADEQNEKSEFINQIREMLLHMRAQNNKRGIKIKATPVLERPLWDKLLSDD